MTDVYTRKQLFASNRMMGDSHSRWKNHQRYYRGIVNACGGAEEFKEVIPYFMERIVQALQVGDTHLNTLPLNRWDTYGNYLYNNPAVIAALKERGDFWSNATAVCILKEAAIMLAETHMAEKPKDPETDNDLPQE